MSRANDDLLGLLVAETQDYAIFMLDLGGNVATWNAGAKRLKGYQTDEIVGRHFSVFYPPEDVAAGKPARELEVALAEGRLEDEGWRVRNDGSRFWANVVITALRDADGSLLGFGKVTRDLTERREHELALREREELVSGALSAATECSIIATDLDGLITLFNSGAEQMLGYRAQELVGVHTPTLIHDWDEIVARAERLGIAPGFEVFATGPRDGGAETRLWTYVRKDGSRLPVELTMSVMLDGDQRPRGFIAVAVDLSERRQSEAVLRSSERSVREGEARMKALLEHAPISISLRDLDGRLVLINRARAELMGLTVQEALAAKPTQDFLDPRVHVRLDERERERLAEQERRIRQGGAPTTTEFSGPGAGGAEHHYLVTKYPVTDGTDTVVGVGGISIDITERRLAEQRLQASEANLRNVAAVARGLQSHENPRQAICDAAAAIAGADIVQLYEPDGDAYLRATTATGATLSADLRVPIDSETSTTATAFKRRQRQIIPNTYARDTSIMPRLRDQLGAASVVCEPIVGRAGALGVLVLIWRTAITEMHDRDFEVVGLLATEAAAAIERADLTAGLHAHKDELRLRQLLEATPDAMIVTNAGGIIQTVNDQTQRLFGYTSDELVGASVEMLVPEAQGTGHPAHRATFMAAPSNRPMGVERELHARHKDGHQIPISVTLSPVQTDDGLWAIAAVRDVTERRLAEERLRAAEEQFRCSFDAAPIGMTILDLDGRFLQVNDAFCAILGHPRATLLGLPRQALTHPDDLAKDEEAIGELLAGTASSFTREKRFLHATGRPVWTLINVTLIRDAQDRPHHFITQAQDITERRLYETQLQHLADHDPLTGLLNRRSFQRELDSHVARVKRLGPVGAVLMVDLDNFKYYNDTQGHSAGDDLIVRVAQTLRARLRETDVIARLGGDEFAILLPREDRDSSEIVARELLTLVSEQAPAPTLGEQRRVTASIGIACFADGDQLLSEEIMVNADLAMYDAKENGRNRSAQYSSEEHHRPRIESQMKWASEITSALAEDRFELLAQPIMSLRAESSTRYELLLRMRDAHGDRIPPGTFLYIAERLGLIHEIDRWVVAHAIDLLAEHRAVGRDLCFEVNLSGHSIGDPLLLELIEQRLQETAVPPDRLIFEITETAAVANIARAATFAERLSDLGCKFALDDFGAGFGSFYYLKHLPFDYLKIDGEYVRHCTTNKTDRILIAAVVQIAHDMGKSTIAEFVGDQESVDVLTRLGVDYGQGYFLGHPEPLVDHLVGSRG